MIKVDFKKYFRDRAWFGWRFHYWSNSQWAWQPGLGEGSWRRTKSTCPAVTPWVIDD